ncbi:MAG: hypothetical protein FJX42_13475 [Alphaproteobacteria bacterium]|nr:hypothetical protein [Alphaproteobacteria bacterium]
MTDKTSAAPNVPDRVIIFYAQVGSLHAFNSMDIPGLNVASDDLLEAYGQLADAVSALVQVESGQKVKYELEGSFADFQRAIDDSHSAELKARLVTQRLAA